MELIVGILLGGGISCITLLIKDKVDANKMERWQSWYSESSYSQQAQPVSQAVPVKANQQAERTVTPKSQPKPQPKPQPQPQINESDDELDRLMSMVDED